MYIKLHYISINIWNPTFLNNICNLLLFFTDFTLCYLLDLKFYGYPDFSNQIETNNKSDQN